MTNIKKRGCAMERFFLKTNEATKETYLLEEDGDFYGHSIQDLIIAKFYNEDYAKRVCFLLNEDL
jgi:membrane protein involved in colicin uptake